MQLRASGIRDIALVQGISPATVLRCLISESLNAVAKPKKRYYSQVQIDELWMYVARKRKYGSGMLTAIKQMKCWLLPWVNGTVKQYIIYS